MQGIKRLTRTLILVAACSLVSVACEKKDGDPQAGTADAAAAQADAGAAVKQTDEDRMLSALKRVGDILMENMDDPENALRGVESYLKENEKELTDTVARLRKKLENMAPEEAEIYQKDYSSRPEMSRYEAAFDRFVERHSDEHITRLEDLLNPIQSAGADEDTIVETAESNSGDPTVLFQKAETGFTELQAFDFTTLGDAQARAKFQELGKRAGALEDDYQRVFQMTKEPELAVKSLIRAGDLYVLLANKIVSMPPPADTKDPAEFTKYKTEAAKPLQTKALSLYGAAVKRADQKSLKNTEVERVRGIVKAAESSGKMPEVKMPEGPGTDGTAPAPGTDGTAPAPGTDGGTPPGTDGAGTPEKKDGAAPAPEKAPAPTKDSAPEKAPTAP